ncbi:MAG: ATP-binding cassette domain-containing protein [Rhodothermales bacterium]
MIVEHLEKSFRKGSVVEPVLRGVSFELGGGDRLAVLGASGCGKTTLLRVLAGLIPGDAGRVELGGEDVSAWPPERRRIVYMPQDALLFPHLSARGNVAFPLQVRRPVPDDANAQVDDLLDRLDLWEHRDKQPHELSGGQQQRVAFGRALLAEPRVLLLDEPFGALDHLARNAMQDVYLELSVARGLSSVFVTHDPREALRVGNRWAWMEQGRLVLVPSKERFVAMEQTGIPREQAFWREVGGV